MKIGVGVLRKPDDKRYDHYRSYEIVQGNKWDVEKTATSVTFQQTVNDPGSGYSDVYVKTVALVPGKCELTIAHTVRNAGQKAINGFVYERNFMRWDNQTPDPDDSMHLHFDPKPAEPLSDVPLAFNGRAVIFTRSLTGKESLRVLLAGFGQDPSDYDFGFENRKLGIGLRHTADQPLDRAVIWGIRAVFAIEPFINYAIQPGAQFSWKHTYQAYELASRK